MHLPQGATVEESSVRLVLAPPSKMKPGPSKNKSKNNVKVIPPPREDQCHYYVERKRRYCNLEISPGKLYCGQHLYLDTNGIGEDRVFCPYDGKHTVKKKDLERHLLKCNSQPIKLEDWCVKDCNLLRKDQLTSDKRLSPKDIPLDEFLQLCQWLKDQYTKAYADEPIIEEYLAHSALETKIESQAKAKHAAQQASLVAHMEKSGFLNDTRTFIEFGAGKGELSRWVWTASSPEVKEKDSNCSEEMKSSLSFNKYILVDRCNFRRKFDSYVSHGITDMSEKKANRSNYRLTGNIQRVLADIKDLNLEKIKNIDDSPIVGICKHLCGSATDLALISLTNYIKSGGLVDGIVMAVCCHHVCNYSSCLIESITPRQHEFLRAIAAWATCAWGKKNENDNDDEHGNNELNEEEICDMEHWSGMNQSQREEIGYMAKRLIDAGRRDYLRSLGLDVKLVSFVPKSTSLENVVLIARSSKTN